MSTKLAQVQALFLERGENLRNGEMELTDRKLMQAGIDAMGMHAWNGLEQLRVDCAARGCDGIFAHGKLHNIFPAHGADELMGGALRNHLAVIHNSHPVRQALGFVHVMSGQNNGATGLLELVDQVP